MATEGEHFRNSAHARSHSRLEPLDTDRAHQRGGPDRRDRRRLLLGDAALADRRLRAPRAGASANGPTGNPLAGAPQGGAIIFASKSWSRGGGACGGRWLARFF